jgi:RNA polymerase sigma factor (sigma-70 family)
LPAPEGKRARSAEVRLAPQLRGGSVRSDLIARRLLRSLQEGSSRISESLERELVSRSLAGDASARAALVEVFLPSIGGMARNYRSARQVSQLELVQEGVAGLLRALERYDPALGVPFWGYASWWVRQAMQQLVGELNRPLVLSDRALRQLSKVKQAFAELQKREGRAPTLGELAALTDLHEDQLANLIAADRPPRALEEPLAGEEGAVGTFGELLVDPLGEDEYERVVSHVTADELRTLLSRLSERERAVLRARYGLDGGPQSLRQLAGQLGVSAERVRQLENRALGKLRAAATLEEG